MGDGGLNNKQFVAIALIIIMCGIAIIGRDYFLEKRANVYEEMSILLSQEPEVMEEVVDEEGNLDTTSVPVSTGDTSGKVKKSNVVYNYVGRLKIPVINLNRGFVEFGSSGNNVNQNIAIMNTSTYPNYRNSNFILAAHNGSGWNAFFTNIDKLDYGDRAYITYKGVQYEYQLVRKYKDKKHDGVTLYKHSNNKQLTLITCKRPDYKTYYLVLVFELVNEVNI